MSFWELAIVLVVGLLVIGPARLPEAIKTGFKWFTKVKRTISDVRTDFEKQIGADEIRRELRNEEIMQNLEELKTVRKQLEQAASNIKDDSQGTTIDGEHEEISDHAFSNEHDHEHDHDNHYEHNSDAQRASKLTTENSIGNHAPQTKTASAKDASSSEALQTTPKSAS